MKISKFFLGLIGVLMLVGCSPNNTDSPSNSASNPSIIPSGEPSTSTSDTMSESSSTLEPEYVERTIIYSENALACTTSGTPTISIDGVELVETSQYYINPVRFVDNNVRNTIQIQSCPISKTTGKIIVYTANYYLSHTNERENVTEYVIRKIDDTNLIDEIYDGSKTKIPLNGFVISVPNDYETSASLKQNSKVDTSLRYPVYTSALTTARGTRMPIETTNNKSFDSSIVNFYDNGADSEVVLTKSNLNTVEFHFNENEQKYEVSNYNQKVYDYDLVIPKEGFILAGSVSNTIKLQQGVIFKNGDFVEFENTPESFNEKINYSLTGSDPSVRVFHGTTSGGNEWGYEVAVLDDRVYSNAVNVTVPTGGYGIRFSSFSTPIEGHIKSLRKIFKVGVEILVNNNILTVNYNVPNFSEQYVSYMKSNTDKRLNDAINNLYDYNVNNLKTISNELEKIQTKIQKYKQNYSEDTIKYYLINLINYAKVLNDKSILNAVQNSPVETRSVWHYPYSEHNVQDVQNMIKKFKDSNLNEVVLSGDLEGYLSFTSEYGIISPNVDGNFSPYKDYLDAFVSEAHKQNIKVQVCMTNWFSYDSLIVVNPQLSNYFATNYDGTEGTDGPGEITKFLDPANPIVRNTYLNMYKEIIDNYDIDGLHLDYIRYGAYNDGSSPQSNSQGYTQATLDGFKEKYPSETHGINNLEQLKTRLRNSGSLYNLFSDYRRYLVTSFVEEVQALLDSHHQLTFAVVSNAKYARDAKLQDWQSWVEAHLVDGLYLMAYYCDYGYVVKDSQSALVLAKDFSNVITGISSIASNLEIMEIATQFMAAREIYVEGICLFASHSYGSRPDVVEIFNNVEKGSGINRQDAVVTYESNDVLLKAYFDMLKDRANRIYKESDYMSDSQYTNFVNILNTIYEEHLNFSADVIYHALNDLLLRVKNDEFGDGPVADRISETLNNAKNTFLIKYNTMEWN